MDIQLFFKALVRFITGVLLMGVLLFLPAGTINYIGGWLLMALLFIPMLIVGIVMVFRNPDLLKKRINAKEKENEQSLVVALTGLMFIAAFLVAGFDFRYGWSVVPESLVWSAVLLFLLAYFMYAEVLRENVYLSRIIEVQENQRVIDTGLYGVVRHPMYSATILLFLSMPLVLGSLPSFVIMLVYIPLIAKRIRNEEKVLCEGLEGYKDYCRRVRYKVIPFLW